MAEYGFLIYKGEALGSITNMMRLYNIRGRYFYLLFILLLFVQVQANGMADPFVITETCVPNPQCAENGTIFTEAATSKAIKWLWTFDDGSTADTRSTIKAYQTPGAHSVTLTRTFADGSTTIESQSFTINEPPPTFQNWKADSTICKGDTITLDPYPNGAPDGAKYVWYPKGDTTQTLRVDSSGCYSVEVIMPNGCKLQDKINVKICMESSGQEGAKWYFGANAGLNFSASPPSPITDGKINTKEGVSSIANSKGELLFYSDGIKVWNKDGDEMTCLGGPCAPLKGSATSTQSVLIVPQPTCRGCEYLFNVFTTTEIEGEKYLSKSVVDMRRNNGKGAIIEQNTLLQQPTTERIASVENKRDTTYWVISHDYGTNKFRVFHATSGGLVETSAPELGMVHDTPAKAQGYMKFSSPDSTTGSRKLAVVVPGPPKNYVELFAFDDSTGTLTYSKTIDLGNAPPTAYGIEFSSSGEKMYVSFQGDGNGAKSYLKQYDLTMPDSLIVETAIVLDSSSTQKFGALQFASDGKIYMAIQGADHLAFIDDPEADVIRRIGYKRDGVSLGGKKSELGLPNMVQDFTQESSGPGFDANGFCTNEPTMFEASPICDPIEDSYSWNFNFDPAKPTEGFAAGKQQATHTYTQPGTYLVALQARNKCTDTTMVKEITIYETPQGLNLGPDKDTCGAYVPLSINVKADNYVWRRLGRVVSRQKDYRALNSGDYIAYAFNGPNDECYATDTIKITLRKPPPFSIGPDTTMCRDSSVALGVQSQRWIEFKWNTGETTRDIRANTPGAYWVIVKDGNDCYNSDTLNVSELPSPVLNLLPEYVLCLSDGKSVDLDAGGVGNLKYIWSPSGATTPTLTVDKMGEYSVVATNTNGCSLRKITQVINKCEPLLSIPDAFTPDSDDGVWNEDLAIKGKYFTNFSIRIYNRWGEVIFASTDVEKRWDGTYKREKVHPGVYPYIVSYEARDFPERGSIVKRGSIMVIR